MQLHIYRSICFFGSRSDQSATVNALNVMWNGHCVTGDGWRLKSKDQCKTVNVNCWSVMGDVERSKRHDRCAAINQCVTGEMYQSRYSYRRVTVDKQQYYMWWMWHGRCVRAKAKLSICNGWRETVEVYVRGWYVAINLQRSMRRWRRVRANSICWCIPT